MRVLIVSQYFWPEEFRINEVVVLTGKPNYPEGRFADGYGFLRRARERWHSVEIVRAPLIPRGSGRPLRLMLNYASFALLASIVGPLRCKRGVDAILVYEPSPVTVGLPALAMKAVTRAPVLFWVQDLWPESLSATGAVHSRSVLKAVATLVRFLYARCARVLVQSRAFVAPIRALGVPEHRIVYFPNSAEDFYLPLDSLRAVPPVELPPGFRVMFAGNVGAAQGFETILAAAELLRSHREIHWLIIGDGRQLPWVRAEIARRGLDEIVHLLGRHPAQSMPVWFAHADALLVSLRAEPVFAMTIPAKVQSYMACGRPIVASLDGEGARVIREAGAGLTAPADDATALAKAVLQLYRMPAFARDKMGACGRAYFERHFERKALLAQLVALMEETTRERGA
jgi:glycosyltransferase involved in cell wall biosynthesis